MADNPKETPAGDEILRRLLKTPPQPKETAKDKKSKRKPKKEKPGHNGLSNS